MQYFQMILNALHNPTVVMIGVAGGEAAMRMWPTSKAWGFAHMGAAIARQIADGLQAFADFTDKVLPQNVLPPVGGA